MKPFKTLIILSLLLLLSSAFAQEELLKGSANSTALEQDCLGYLLFLPAFVQGKTASLLQVDAGSDFLRDSLFEKSVSFSGSVLRPFARVSQQFSQSERVIGHNLKIAVQRESLSEQFNETIENAKGVLGIRPGSEQDLRFEVGPRVYGVIPSTLINISAAEASTLSEKGFLLECNKRVKASTPVVPTQVELEQAIRGTQPDSLVPDSLKHLTGKGVTIAIIGSGIDYSSKEFGECKKEDFPVVPYDTRERGRFIALPELSKCEKIPVAINMWGALRETQSAFYIPYGTPAQEYNSSDVEDDFGLSTPLASIAVGNLSGIARDAKLYVIKATDNEGFTGFGTLINSLNFVADPRGDFSFEGSPEIILMNFDFKEATTTFDPVYIDLIKLHSFFLSTLGNSLIIVHSGDSIEKGKIEKIGGDAYTLTIGAVYNKSYKETIQYHHCSDENPKQDQLLCISGKGPTPQKVEADVFGSPYLQGRNSYIVKPDVVAPGDFVCGAKSSFVAETENENTCGEGYSASSGTTTASAVVAGFAALLKQQHSDWSPLELKSALREGADWISGFGYGVNEQGHGKINIQNSLEMHDYPPVAIMDSIVDGKITGLATVRPETDFKQYKIELGKGENPTEWTTLIESETKPEKEIFTSRFVLGAQTLEKSTTYQILCQNLSPAELGNGFYTLKLTVESRSGQSATDYLQFAVKGGEFTGPETPLEALLETGSGDYYGYGFDRTIFSHEFGEISENTCDYSVEHPQSIEEAGHFCDGYQSLIAIVKKLQGYESQGLGENQSIVEFQAFLIGDTYSEAFKELFQEKYGEYLENLPSVAEWEITPETIQTGLYNVRIIVDVVEGTPYYSNVRITFTQERSLLELDFEQRTSYAENLFLSQRTPNTIINLEGEPIPLMRTEEKRIDLDKEHLGIGVIEAVNRVDPYEMQDGVILKITKIGEEEGIPHYRLEYTESMPIKIQIPSTAMYYQLLVENQHQSGILKWDNIPVENKITHDEECSGWEEEQNVDYVQSQKGVTAKAFLTNGATVKFLCLVKERSKTAHIEYYNLEEKELQKLKLKKYTYYGGGGNQVMITYSPNVLPSIQQYFQEVKKGLALVEGSEKELIIKWK